MGKAKRPKPLPRGRYNATTQKVRIDKHGHVRIKLRIIDGPHKGRSV